jgi:hypothetical protein
MKQNNTIDIYEEYFDADLQVRVCRGSPPPTLDLAHIHLAHFQPLNT